MIEIDVFRHLEYQPASSDYINLEADLGVLRRFTWTASSRTKQNLLDSTAEG